MSSLKVKIFKKKQTKTSSTVAVSSKTDKEGACISSSPLYLDGTDDGTIRLLLICYFLVTSCWYHENIFFFLVHAFVHSVLAQVEHTWSKKIIVTRCSCGNQSCFHGQGLGCPWVTPGRLYSKIWRIHASFSCVSAASDRAAFGDLTVFLSFSE